MTAQLDIYEGSEEQAISAEIYRFLFTPGSVEYLLTTFNRDITVNTELFLTTAALTRSAFQRTIDFSPSELEITLPVTHPVVAKIKDVATLVGCTLRIERVFYDGATWDFDNRNKLFFGVYMGGAKLADGKCDMKFRDFLTFLERDIARVRLQSPCNNRLFDEVCQLNNVDFSQTETIDYITNERVFQFPKNGNLAIDGYYSLGKIESSSGNLRFISAHTTDASYAYVTIIFPFSNSEVYAGTDVRLIAGCDKAGATCLDKFDNLGQFVGMPYVPTTDLGLVPLTSKDT